MLKITRISCEYILAALQSIVKCLEIVFYTYIYIPHLSSRVFSHKNVMVMDKSDKSDKKSDKSDKSDKADKKGDKARTK